MADFDAALQKVLGHEGGYVNDPRDRGGKTRYGVTEAVARKHGYQGAMSRLPLETAKAIYRKDYWTPFGLDEIPDQRIAYFLFDVAVNHGGGGMARIAQRAVSHRRPVSVDGRWGPATKTAVVELAVGYPENLLGALKVERGRFYLSLVEKNPSQGAFLWGWLKRCAVLLLFVGWSCALTENRPTKVEWAVIGVAVAVNVAGLYLIASSRTEECEP